MKLEKYNAYTIEDYLEDPAFRRWVLDPTPEVDGQWQALFDRYEEQQVIANQARALLLEMKAYFQPNELKEKPLDEAFIRQLKTKVAKAPAAGRKSSRRLFVERLSIAASLLLLVSFFSWFWFGGQSNAMKTYSTQYSERRTVELPDGSMVVLNANSELKTAEKWKAGADRVVWLTGEAHFTVTRQPATQAKFTVITNDLSVHVLGTVFNVHARSQGTQVTLEEGKVSLDLKEQPNKRAYRPREPILMGPGEQVKFSAQTQKLQKTEKVNVIAKSSWKDGILMFDGVTLEGLGIVITETFGYPVEFKDTAAMHQLITGSVPAEDDLDLLLETVEQAFDISIMKRDGALIFE